MRDFLSTVLLVFVFGFSAFADEDSLLSAKSLKHLDSAARLLARAGETEGVEKLCTILARMNYGPDALRKLEAECARRIAKARPGPASIPGAVRKLQFAARQMAAGLPDLQKKQRQTMARILLGIDSEQPAVREALGHVIRDGNWCGADWQEMAGQRARIEAALHDVARLEFETDTTASDSSLLDEILGRPGAMVSWEALTFHSNLSSQRLVRIVNDVLKGLALSNFLRTGILAVPDFIWERDCHNFVVLDTRELYLRAVDTCMNNGLMNETEGSEAKLLSAQFSSAGFCLNFDTTEARIKASLFNFIGDFRESSRYEGQLATCLYAGHMNWICLRLFGSSSPSFAWDEVNEANAGSDGPKYSALSAGQGALGQKALMRLTGSSLYGCRSWLIHLVELGRDPSWPQIAAIDEIERFSGTFLLKSTVVVEYLQEKGVLEKLLVETARHDDSDDSARPFSIARLFETALGESIIDFDHHWKVWLLEHRPGLCQELDALARARSPREDEKLLDCLNTLRLKAWNKESLGPYPRLAIDRSLSKGALAHAEYLDKNPDQSQLWPDCHEEYTDLKGYTAEGCWAGLHAIIWPGSFKNNPEGAVAKWMATFYHRLPILQPGLFRVGWGASRQNAVLDTGTLVLPDDRPYAVFWPYHGMDKVPCRFAPEMPSPVPGEDQSTWGYPITLQVYLGGSEPRYEMKLFVELFGTTGDEIACFFSTPAHPTNPVLAPANAFCLIPKNALESRTAYRVVAKDLGNGDEMIWCFTTE